jgi:hypothetical protein
MPEVFTCDTYNPMINFRDVPRSPDLPQANLIAPNEQNGFPVSI